MFFGHSMGGLIAYELICSLKKENILPTHLFISGKKPPCFKKSKEGIYDLPDKQFKDKLLKLGGTPEEIIKDEILFDIFSPAIRSDFRIVDTYNDFKEEILDIPITIFGGERDTQVDYKSLEFWGKYTTKTIDFHYYDDGHFFINKFSKEITTCIKRKVLDYNI